MQSKTALEPKEETTPTNPIFVEAEKLYNEMRDFSQSIAQKAYEFFEARGRQVGKELEDWFRAESELTRMVPVEIKETETQIIVRAEVPGFKANEISICTEKDSLIISGKVETETEEKNEKTIFSERRTQKFYRSLTLPAEILTDKTEATLKDGILELTLTKAPAEKPVNVEIKTA